MRDLLDEVTAKENEIREQITEVKELLDESEHALYCGRYWEAMLILSDVARDVRDLIEKCVALRYEHGERD